MTTMKRIAQAILLLNICVWKVSTNAIDLKPSTNDQNICERIDEVHIGKNYVKTLCLVQQLLTYEEAKELCSKNKMRLFKSSCVRTSEKCRKKFQEVYHEHEDISVWISQKSTTKLCKKMIFASELEVRKDNCNERNFAFCEIRNKDNLN